MRKGDFLAVLAVLGLMAPGLARAEEASLDVQIVDAMNKVFGVHPGFRANHAKGIVAEGHFKGAPGAAALSRASLFAGGTIPVTVRFSDSTGVPNLPDGAPPASPHGLAMKFHLPDGSDTDMVTNGFKFFPVATGAEFRDLLLALAASPPDAPKPTKFDQFVASHPAVPAAFGSSSTPDSFADDDYYGVDAFVLINAAGQRQAVRYQVLPEHSVHLDAAEAAKRGPDFLMQDLPERLKRGPITFRLMAQLAGPGDSTSDPSKAWPADRKLVELGVLTIDKVVPNSAEVEKKLLFLPGQLTDGIEASDDPLINLRNAAYAVSFSRRSQ